MLEDKLESFSLDCPSVCKYSKEADRHEDIVCPEMCRNELALNLLLIGLHGVVTSGDVMTL